MAAGNFIQSFKRGVSLTLMLLRQPEKWKSFIPAEAFSTKAIYVNLILPLAVLQALPHAISTALFGDFWFAVITLFLRSILAVAIVIIISLLIKQLLKTSSEGKNINATLPYCFVPWLGLQFFAAVLANIAPLVLFGLSWLLALTGIALTLYMLFSYFTHYLVVQPQRFWVVFAVCALLILAGWWYLDSVEEWLIAAIFPYIPL